MNKLFVQKEEFSGKKKNRFILLLAGSIAAALIVVILLFAGYFYYFINTPMSASASEQTFQVSNGEGVRAITKKLETDRIITWDIPFIAYLKVTGLYNDIQTGDYKLSGAMAPLEVADILTKGRVSSKKITIPEGWTRDQIGSYLEQQRIVTKADFLAATEKKYDYDFLKGQPEGNNLEGFLFPDTYYVSATANAEAIVKKMLDNFDKKVAPNVRAAITNSHYSLYQTITIASIVEREVSKPEQRKFVAGIFLARLADGMKLQSDVTVEYGLGISKKELTQADLDTDTPYNTYLHTGLPKGPISNPGLDSIQAVVYPEPTDYLYFITVGDNIYYAKTFAEHSENVAKYLK